MARVMEPGDAIGYGIPPSATFWIGQQQTGDGFRETHIAFQAPDQPPFGPSTRPPSPPEPSRCTSRSSGPSTPPTYYAAFVRDPDGNNIEAVTHSRG